MAGSAIAPEVKIGQDYIINTNATVYHESFLESIASSRKPLNVGKIILQFQLTLG